MKNSKVSVHHTISLRSNPEMYLGVDYMIDYRPNSPVGVKESHLMFETEQDVFNMLFGFDYLESMIGDNRMMTKDEYREISHRIRHENWKQYSQDDYCDTMYHDMQY